MGFRGLPQARQNGLFLFIALARIVTFCKEGGGMLLVWALRARSYKTKAEAWQQGHRPSSSPRGFYGFCLAPSIHQQIRPIRLIRGRKREEFIGKDEQAINHLHFHTFCIKMAAARQKTSKLAFLHSPCTLFPQNPYTIQINALYLHHQNPQAS